VSENIIKQRLEQMLAGQRIILTFEMDDEILSPLEEGKRLVPTVFTECE
jgi:hypothetical protein